MTGFMTSEHKEIRQRGYFKDKKQKIRSRFFTSTILIMLAVFLSLLLPKDMYFVTKILLFSFFISYLTAIVLTVKNSREDSKKMRYHSFSENYVLQNELLLNQEKEMNED